MAKRHIRKLAGLLVLSNSKDKIFIVLGARHSVVLASRRFRNQGKLCDDVMQNFFFTSGTNGTETSIVVPLDGTDESRSVPRSAPELLSLAHGCWPSPCLSRVCFSGSINAIISNPQENSFVPCF